MEASSIVQSTAAASTAAATPSAGIAFSLFKIIMVIACIGILYHFLTKNAPKQKVNEAIKEAKKLFDEGRKLEESAEPGEKASTAGGLGKYLLNLLDGRRVCIPMEDMRLRPGEAILVNASGIDDTHNPYVKEVIGLGRYTTKARELRGEYPIIIMRDMKDGELYLRISDDNTCYFQINGEVDPVEIDPSKKSFRLKDITNYRNESYFIVSGVPLSFSLNKCYVNENGRIERIAIKESERGLSYVDESKIPDSYKKPRKQAEKGPFSN